METKTVGVVILEGDKVLLVRHLKGGNHITDTYGLPAGRLESGEEHAQGAIRELKEETGLDAKTQDLTRLATEYHAILKRKTGEEAMVWTVFKCLKYSGELKDSVETSPEWVEIGRLDSLNLVPNVKNAITQAWECKG